MMPSIRFTALLILSVFFLGCRFLSADTFGTPRFSGSGCPRGSMSVLATEDAITILFDSFSVSTERGEFHFRYCIMRMPVTVSAGYAVSVESVDHRGFASLERRARGFVWSDYALGSREIGSSALTILKGPFTDDFLRRDTTYSRSRTPICGGNRRVNLRISIYTWVTNSHRALGTMSLDSTDGALSVILRRNRCR
jgi:hypothetical protein